MKIRLLNFFLFVGIVFITNCSIAQTETFSPTGSFSIDLGVPAKPQNSAFGRVLEGLFNGGADYRYNVFKGITVGVGGKYSYFNINKFAFDNIGIAGGYHIAAPYLYLGYEKFTTDRISFSGSVRGGYAFMMSVNDSCKAKLDGPSVTEAFFLEPQIEMVMLTDKTSPHGFSMVLGYSFYMNEFSQDELCLQYVPNTTSDSFEGITRFLSIGFGYRYYMGRN